jgi:AmiR/NasT family two-component response regulator
MKRMMVLLALACLGSLVLANVVAAAPPLTRADINDILNKKSQEIANVGAAKAQARLVPMIESVADSFDLKLAAIFDRIAGIDEELGVIGQQTGLLQAGMTNLETATQGSSSQIANLRLVVDEALKKQEAELSAQYEIEKQEMNNTVAEQQREIDSLRARLERRTVMDTAKTILEIGLAGLLVYHVLDHEGR